MSYGSRLGCIGDCSVTPGGITGDPIGEHGASLPRGTKMLFLSVS